MIPRNRPKSDSDYILQLESEVNIWKIRAEAHEENYNEMLKRIDVLVLEKKELSDYADKLAAGLPEGLLPMDIENIREANAQLTDEVTLLKNALLEAWKIIESYRD